LARAAVFVTTDTLCTDTTPRLLVRQSVVPAMPNRTTITNTATVSDALGLYLSNFAVLALMHDTYLPILFKTP
jgi:hypothetical protein